MQLEHLRTSPSVATRVSRGRVQLHGWMYKIETGEIFAYDSHMHQFRLLTELANNEASSEFVRAIA